MMKLENTRKPDDKWIDIIVRKGLGRITVHYLVAGWADEDMFIRHVSVGFTAYQCVMAESKRTCDFLGGFIFKGLSGFRAEGGGSPLFQLLAFSNMARFNQSLTYYMPALWRV